MRFDAGSVRLSALLLPLLFSFQNAMAAPGDLLSTDRTNVNVRSTPSTDGAIVTRINPGETVVEMDSVRDWYRVRIPNQDLEGWVFTPLLSAASNVESQPTVDEAAIPIDDQPSVATLPATDPTAPSSSQSTVSASDRLLSRLDRFDEDLRGDPVRGEAVFVKCGSCHTTVEGVHAQGPSLVGVFGEPPARSRTFRYSGSMEAFAREGAIWDEATLDRFIQRPPRVVKGTSMPFSGLRDAQDRRDVIAFLEKLSR